MKIEILTTLAGLLVVDASRFPCDKGWVDANGNGCEEYEKERYCKNDGDHYGEGWSATLGKFDNWTDSENRTALVCPFCGCKEGLAGNLLFEQEIFVPGGNYLWAFWYNKHTTYNKARSFCWERDGDLPVVESKEEMKWLARNMPRPAFGRAVAWVGGRKTNGTYIWTKSKEPIAENLWADSEPSDGEECVMLNKYGFLGYDQHDRPKIGEALNSCSCGSGCTAFIVCQKPIKKSLK